MTDARLACCVCDRRLYRHACDCSAAVEWAAHWDGRVWCGPCVRAEHAKAKARRKAQLDAMPRCSIDGCNRRGTWRIGHGGVLLVCGIHRTRAKRAHNQRMAAAGGMGLFMPVAYGAEELRELAQ